MSEVALGISGRACSPADMHAAASYPGPEPEGQRAAIGCDSFCGLDHVAGSVSGAWVFHEFTVLSDAGWVGLGG